MKISCFIVALLAPHHPQVDKHANREYTNTGKMKPKPSIDENYETTALGGTDGEKPDVFGTILYPTL